MNTFLAVLLTKLYIFIIDLQTICSLQKKKIESTIFLAILKENDYFKKGIKTISIKILSCPQKNERSFKSSHKCWICNKLFTPEDDEVRDLDHVVGKYRGSAHQSCNVNLKFTKIVPVKFHNLRGYDSDS